MAQINFSVDSTDVMQEMGGVIPAGNYEAIIEASELKITKAGDPMLNLQLSVIKGEFKGRKVFDTALFDHSASPEAARIGRQKINTICTACGISKLTDTDELINKPVKIKVSIKNDHQYGDKNVVKMYSPFNESQPTNQQAPTTPGAKPSFIK